MKVKAKCLVAPFLMIVSGWSSCAGGQEAVATIEPCPRDAAGFVRIQKLADTDSPEAQATLWDCYEQGRNVDPDGKKAIEWLKLSAQQGFVPAEYELGRTYLYGRGIPADYAQARVWEEKAAQSGHLNAQRDMGFIYERGLGVAADPERAAFWNRKAAQQGDAQAELHLADALTHGNGVPADPQEANLWYRKAAQQGLPEAEMRVAEIEERELKDCAAALNWYEKAARGGLTEAMLRLGAIYQEGRCAEIKLESAYIWYYLGQRNGSPECRKAATKLIVRLSPAQKVRAERVAENWIKHNSTATDDEDEEKRPTR